MVLLAYPFSFMVGIGCATLVPKHEKCLELLSGGAISIAVHAAGGDTLTQLDLRQMHHWQEEPAVDAAPSIAHPAQRARLCSSSSAAY